MNIEKEFKLSLKERLLNRIEANEQGYVVELPEGGQMLTFGREALKYKIVARMTMEKWLEGRKHDH